MEEKSRMYSETTVVVTHMLHVFNDCNGGGNDQTQNRQNLKIENILVLRNARQPLNNLIHSTTLPVDAVN